MKEISSRKKHRNRDDAFYQGNHMGKEKSAISFYKTSASFGQRSSLLLFLFIFVTSMLFVTSNWWIESKKSYIRECGDRIYNIISDESLNVSYKIDVLNEIINDSHNDSFFQDIAFFYLEDIYKDNERHAELLKLYESYGYSKNRILKELRNYYYNIFKLYNRSGDIKIAKDLEEKMQFTYLNLLAKDLLVLEEIKKGNKKEAKHIIGEILLDKNVTPSVKSYLYELLTLTR